MSLNRSIAFIGSIFLIFLSIDSVNYFFPRPTGNEFLDLILTAGAASLLVFGVVFGLSKGHPQL